MKTRIGFVSNSSTTSFCIYGIRTEDEKIKEIIENIDYLKLREFGISTYSHYDEGATFIGRSFHAIRDDETGLEFKNNTKLILKELLKENVDDQCFIYQEGWYDG